MIKTDALLIGGGLAGSILALTLLRRGHRVHLVDAPQRSRCSRVAAGMLNPVNFHTMAGTWKAETVVPFAQQFYARLNAQLPQPVFVPRTLYRVLSETEAQRWPQDKPFFGSLCENLFPGVIQAPYGLGGIHEAGALDTVGLIDAVHNNVTRSPNFSVSEENFSFTDIEVNATGVRCGNISAERIIFCEGHLLSENPFFNFIPLMPLKGQLALIEAEQLHTDTILNGAANGKGGYLVPRGEGRYLFGATHERNRADEIVTPEGRHDLEEKIRQLLNVPFRIIDTMAGVRPTIRDRRPVLGLHPAQPRIAVFNGLGSKGTMQGPWLAEQLAAHLDNGAALPKEVDVRRFR